jgi:hypothetical protein
MPDIVVLHPRLAHELEVELALASSSYPEVSHQLGESGRFASAKLLELHLQILEQMTDQLVSPLRAESFLDQSGVCDEPAEIVPLRLVGRIFIEPTVDLEVVLSSSLKAASCVLFYRGHVLPPPFLKLFEWRNR